MSEGKGRPTLAEGIARAKATKGAVLLDVRSPQEYASGHVPGSVNLPLERVAAITLPKGTPLFVYCRSGVRSSQACQVLSQLGYQAVNIGGVLGYSGPLATLK